MGRKATVEQEEVIRAAIELVKARKHASVRNVRAALGDRGNVGTISAMIEHWCASLDPESRDLLPPRVPAELIEPLLSLWDVAIAEAGRRHEEARAQARGEIEEAQTARRQAEEGRAAAQAEQRRLADLLDERGKLLEAVQAEREEVSAKAQALEAQLREAVQARDSERAQAEQVHAALRKENERLAEVLRHERERFDAQQAYWAKQVDQAREEARALQAQAERERQAAASKLAEYQKRVEDKGGELLEAQQSLIEIRAQHEALQSRLTEQTRWLEQRCQELAAARQSWIEERRELQSALRNVQKRVQALGTTNARLLERWKQAWKRGQAGEGAESRQPDR
ncbi:MAG: DNA-binding protein [Nitrococcus sp.]|nr:DNA-binding protein [Nitrococcus sp.]